MEKEDFIKKRRELIDLTGYLALIKPQYFNNKCNNNKDFSEKNERGM